ncbi:hypothetical protein PL321_06290 [Caloramator sp. mosi_1]|uniref:hypothetical protein n=1 Tax=Caloramator sp. mosi_1 TaxID=3023090 RepID=UPI00235FC3B6|nr:hypothetical protein [Caloramator sp. mosi_1]WDC85104.1 hypothetical protein PL321_06290 [Caloramator sp. mosi_1]
MLGRSGTLDVGKFYILDGREFIADGTTGALYFSKVGGKLNRNNDNIKMAIEK